MSILSKSPTPLPQNRLLLHGLFWVASVMLLTYCGSLFGGDFELNLLYMLGILPVQMLAAYLLVYFQIPVWLKAGSWLKFIVLSAIVAYLLAALARLSVIYIAEPLMGVDGIDESLWEVLTDPIYLIRVYMATAYLPSIFFFLIKRTKEGYEKENQIVKLEKEKQEAELNFLKAQINPHFLFNTLNNIYALALKKEDEAPEMILKLSEILDYTIYECKADRVEVIKEWELIENYADLQALRHHNQMTVVLNQEIKNKNSKIAPLILISLVENAFKHGLKGKREGSTIEISLLEMNDELIFKIFNTKSDQSKNSNKGIGLENIKRQLDLQYPGQYEMVIEEQKVSYQVILKMDLK